MESQTIAWSRWWPSVHANESTKKRTDGFSARTDRQHESTRAVLACWRWAAPQIRAEGARVTSQEVGCRGILLSPPSHRASSSPSNQDMPLRTSRHSARACPDRDCRGNGGIQDRGTCLEQPSMALDSGNPSRNDGDTPTWGGMAGVKRCTAERLPRIAAFGAERMSWRCRVTLR
jgi:hypothetical protein